MTEVLKSFDDVTKRINRLKYFLLGDDEPSGDVDFLLAPGKIEELVREGRAPILRGQIGIPGEELQPYYQVPPRGLDKTLIVEKYSSNGCIVFIDNFGTQRIGSVYTLTPDQAREVEERISDETKKIGIK